ncbi:uncharacterized protein BDR25DRAFT_353825 [Lindgomyces ingoldianus]|uniref:Uncharacterized protein n=1 Tax=Lindgomyces ingoldianus TaxID=673940 RepID=A0ACB6R175_9PLEO|nr:uncharacterized protein BDR25DRAFT_353825 [Lindgomyces ingoldianus]KAF2472085.1 hypothetical protein BDR25DRAFT_353825 [Lindgomyces ingoldianus]
MFHLLNQLVTKKRSDCREQIHGVYEIALAERFIEECGEKTHDDIMFSTLGSQLRCRRSFVLKKGEKVSMRPNQTSFLLGFSQGGHTQIFPSSLYRPLAPLFHRILAFLFPITEDSSRNYPSGIAGIPSSNCCETCKLVVICSATKRGQLVDHAGKAVVTAQAYQPLGSDLSETMIHRPQQQHSLWSSEFGEKVASASAKNLHIMMLQSTQRDGGMFLNMRLLDLGRRVSTSSSSQERTSLVPGSPAYSSNEVLAQILYTILNWSDPGRSIIFISTGCGYGSFPSDLAVLNHMLYGKALQSLQAPINNSEEQFSPNTLAAVSAIWRVKGIFATVDRSLKQTIHARALSHMLKVRGIRNLDDPLEFFLTLECQLHCIFDSEDWDVAFQQWRGQSELSMRYWTLLRGFRPFFGRRTLPSHCRCYEARNHTSFHWCRTLQPNDFYNQAPPTTDPLVPIVFELRDTEIAPLLGYHFLYSILIHRMATHLSSLLLIDPVSSQMLDPTLSPTYFFFAFPVSIGIDNPNAFFPTNPLPSLSRSKPLIFLLRVRNVQLSQRIWMMYSQVRLWKPIGCLFYLNALKCSFLWAGTTEMRVDSECRERYRGLLTREYWVRAGQSGAFISER